MHWQIIKNLKNKKVQKRNFSARPGVMTVVHVVLGPEAEFLRFNTNWGD